MKTNTYPFLNEEVSRLGFGAFGLMGVFGEFSETDAIDAIHGSWDSGVNFIDTATLRPLRRNHRQGDQKLEWLHEALHRF